MSDSARDGPGSDRHAEPAVMDLSQISFASLANSLPLSVIVKDLSGRRLFVNQAYLDRRGKSREQLIGRRDEELFPPQIAQQYRLDDRRVIESGNSLHNIEQAVDRDGNACWIERVKSPIVDERGQIVGVQAIFWDVTQRVVADRDLKHERGLLDTLLRNIPDSIYFKDEQSRFVRISEAMAAKFGLENAAAAIGKTDADIFTEEHAVAARQDELRIMQTGHPVVDLVERETWPDRDDSWCLSTKMPLRDSDGKVIGTFGISRDITELKRYQDELKEARDAADAANRAKSDFLANMSHEIRTPMNAIIGMSELLAQTELNREQQDYVNLVRESADALLQLLNEILDFSKIEAHKLQLESIPFSTRDVVEKSGQTLSVRAAEKGLELACRVDPNLPGRMLGDPGRLRQVLINLIGNAIKFTEQGEVFVEVSRDPEAEITGDPRVAVRFSVRDTGIGIPEDQQQRILDPFTQADASTTRRYGGTGLGLAISKQLVELMGGELRLDSQPGYGTNFFFTAYFEIAEAGEAEPAEPLATLEGLPVLLVDDNATNLRILNEIFSRWKLRPVLASSGDEALAAISQAKHDDDLFALAVLDCMMPGMDGFELAERIRAQIPERQMQLIILSSATRGDDIERCRNLNIARYLTKPVVQSELLDTVVQVMQPETQPQLPPEQSFPRCPPMRILVAEDGIANQRVAVGMLKAGGHFPVVVSDGSEAVERWQQERFDLILMDMHMPEMDGIEATKAIRQLEASDREHIPIVALTAAAMKEDIEVCRNAGMDAYLAKPIHLVGLHETLARFAPTPARADQSADASASTSQPRDVQDQSAPQAGGFDDPSDASPAAIPTDRSASNQEVPGQDPQSGPPIDLNAAAKRVPGGLAGVRTLAEVFFAECTDLMAELERSLNQSDRAAARTQIQRSAHTLKSSANLFGADAVSRTAQQIEQMAAGNSLEDVDPLWDTLKQEVGRTVAALHKFVEDPQAKS